MAFEFVLEHSFQDSIDVFFWLLKVKTHSVSRWVDLTCYLRVFVAKTLIFLIRGANIETGSPPR